MTQTPNKNYALTGKLRVGKDYVAAACEGQTLGFADPFYQIADALFGQQTGNKDQIPGLRKFYQQLGQWGRGVVNDEYPITAERAVFTSWIRRHGPELTDIPVQWELYGLEEDIWLHALLARAFRLSGEGAHDGEGNPVESDAPLLFVSNCRFKNEYDALTEAGFDHFHVLCSDATYQDRLRSAGIAPNDPRLNDYSEQFARQYDQAVAQTLRTHETGTKLKVIWNDSRPAPSPRLFTVEEFKQYVIENGKSNPTTSDTIETTATDHSGTDTADAGEGEPVLADAPAEAPVGKPSGKNKRGRRAVS